MKQFAYNWVCLAATGMQYSSSNQINDFRDNKDELLCVSVFHKALSFEISIHIILLVSVGL